MINSGEFFRPTIEYPTVLAPPPTHNPLRARPTIT
jgi:hypothetical protein